jgi:thiamine phosphate synthase YjbQ (UPF0047 family)
LECVVLDSRSLGKPAAEFRDPFTLAHQLNLRLAEFFSFGEVIARFVRQIRLSKRTVDRFVHHDFAGLSILDSFINKNVSSDLVVFLFNALENPDRGAGGRGWVEHVTTSRL